MLVSIEFFLAAVARRYWQLGALVLSVALSAVATLSAAAQERRVPDTIAARVSACTICHGKQGRATNDGYFPRIAGKPAGYLYNQLVNFREGRRSYPAMNHLLEYLSDDYLREIAQYFADIDLPYPPPVTAANSAALLQRGERLAHDGDSAREIPGCVACHDRSLTGVIPSVPGLIGLPRDYLNAQLGAWRSGQRRAAAPDCMAHIAKALTPEDISALTAWIASRPIPTTAKPQTRWLQEPPMRCGSIVPSP